MAMTEHVLVEFDAADGIATLRLNRPASFNALNEALAVELAAQPPHAFAATKRLLHDARGGTLDPELAAEQQSFLQCTAHP